MIPDQNDIPGWVRWIAQDADGTWWGYSVEPLPQTRGWYENEVGQYVRLHCQDPNPDWRRSLHRIRSSDHSSA